MISAGTPQDTAAVAVLYVCADRGTLMPSLGAERAEAEGRAFAQQHRFKLAEVITDKYGEPDPAQRRGWQRVRELAQAGAVGAVLVRWPAAIAPEAAHDLRYRETSWLQEQGVRIRYTWAPLAKTAGEDR